VTTRVQLIEKFFAMKQGSGEAVNVYVARLQETEHRLKEQGEQISGTMALFVLLRSATSRFPTLVTLLKMREDLTFDAAVDALKNEEERQKADGSDDDRSGRGGRAYIASGGGAKKETRRCHECGEVGHMKYSCPKVECARCKRNGHLAANCRATKPAYNRGGGGGGAGSSGYKHKDNDHENEFVAYAKNHFDDEEEDEDWSA
jgi:hypothetical protein